MFMTASREQISAVTAQASIFRTFEDLEVYQQSRLFRKDIYTLVKVLPEHEKFGLANQMRRAAVSLSSNIAEGHGRYHFPDQIKFMLNSRGSLEELIDQLNICLDESYLSAEEVADLKSRAWNVHNIHNGYIRYLGGRIDQNARVQELPSDFDV
jgi:four helix bundle protein